MKKITIFRNKITKSLESFRHSNVVLVSYLIGKHDKLLSQFFHDIMEFMLFPTTALCYFDPGSICI